MVLSDHCSDLTSGIRDAHLSDSADYRGQHGYYGIRTALGCGSNLTSLRIPRFCSLRRLEISKEIRRIDFSSVV